MEIYPTPSTVQLKMKGDLCLIPRSRSIQNAGGYKLDPPLPFHSEGKERVRYIFLRMEMGGRSFPAV